MLEVRLCKWALKLKGSHFRVGTFVIDRMDNKRRLTSELKHILFQLNRTPVADQKLYTIASYEEFRGFALSYGCKP